MLRTVSSLPLAGPLTLGFDAGRFPPTPPACYRASWQLPGPDFHRQATTSFRTARTPLRHGVTSCSAGRTKSGSLAPHQQTSLNIVVTGTDVAVAHVMGDGGCGPSTTRLREAELHCDIDAPTVDVVDTSAPAVPPSPSPWLQLRRGPPRQPGLYWFVNRIAVAA
jgi:hypothetical protein